jgi:hypothetical protein
MLPSRFALALSIVLPTFPFYQVFAAQLPDLHDDCTTGWVLSSLKANVFGKYRRYISESLLLTEIIDPEMQRETLRDEQHRVGRKFCHATARLSDGTERDLWYLIEYPWGFAGAPLSSVEFCIAGLDPWHVYGNNCSTVR